MSFPTSTVSRCHSCGVAGAPQSYHCMCFNPDDAAAPYRGVCRDCADRPELANEPDANHRMRRRCDPTPEYQAFLDGPFTDYTQSRPTFQSWRPGDPLPAGPPEFVGQKCTCCVGLRALNPHPRWMARRLGVKSWLWWN